MTADRHQALRVGLLRSISSRMHSSACFSPSEIGFREVDRLRVPNRSVKKSLVTIDRNPQL